MTALPPPGWHPDPYGTAQLRWWDGAAWSGHVHPTERATPAAAVAAAILEDFEREYEDDYDPSAGAHLRRQHLDEERPVLTTAIQALLDALAPGEVVAALRSGVRYPGMVRRTGVDVEVAAVTTGGGIVVRQLRSLETRTHDAATIRREPWARIRLDELPRRPRPGPLWMRWSEEDGIVIGTRDADLWKQAERFLAAPTPVVLDRYSVLLAG